MKYLLKELLWLFTGMWQNIISSLILKGKQQAAYRSTIY